MKTVLLSLVLLVATNVQASTFADSNLEAIAKLAPQKIEGIEQSIKKAVSKETGFKLQSFKVQWDETQCTLAGESELSGQNGGTCIVTATAFQTFARVGLIIGQGKTTVSVIYVDVE